MLGRSKATLEGLPAPLPISQGGTGQATQTFPVIVALRMLENQGAVDGSGAAFNLYFVPVDGVYRASGCIIARTKSSIAWQVDAGITMPTGTNIDGAFAASRVQMQTGVLAGYNNIVTVPPVILHAGDVIAVGTVTSGGASNGTGKFDVCWTVERLA